MLLARHTSLTIKPEVDLANLLSFVLTLLLLLIFNLFYERRHQSEQFGKDRIIRSVDNADEALDNINEAFEASVFTNSITQEQKVRILRALTRYSNALHSIQHALEACGIDACSGLMDGARGQMMGLKSLLTDVPFSSGKFDESVQREHDGRCKTIRDTLNDIVFTINQL